MKVGDLVEIINNTESTYTDYFWEGYIGRWAKIIYIDDVRAKLHLTAPLKGEKYFMTKNLWTGLQNIRLIYLSFDYPSANFRHK